MTEREKFEAFICEYYPLTQNIAKEKGLSITDIHQAEWDVWQAAKADAVHECKWHKLYDGSVFDTDCNHTFELSNTYSLTENNFKHCFYCGGKIKEAQEQGK